MFVDKEAILRWLLLAERFDLLSFLSKCANHAAMHFRDVCKDPKFHQLGTSALKAVIRALHLLIDLYPGLQSAAPYNVRQAMEVSKDFFVCRRPALQKSHTSSLPH